jgi:hypothetical protein
MDRNIFNATDSIKTIELAIIEAKTLKTGSSFYYILVPHFQLVPCFPLFPQHLRDGAEL